MDIVFIQYFMMFAEKYELEIALIITLFFMCFAAAISETK